MNNDWWFRCSYNEQFGKRYFLLLTVRTSDSYSVPLWRPQSIVSSFVVGLELPATMWRIAWCMLYDGKYSVSLETWSVSKSLKVLEEERRASELSGFLTRRMPLMRLRSWMELSFRAWAQGAHRWKGSLNEYDCIRHTNAIKFLFLKVFCLIEDWKQHLLLFVL